MRLCDEYSERMGLGKLYFRHSSRFFLFFEGGDRLLSCKWIHSDHSCGRYEFVESALGRTVSSLRKDDVEWDGYEDFLSGWLLSHDDLVFGRSRVFDLAWLFFVRRNDRFLSSMIDPVVVYSTLDPSNPSRAASALELLDRISRINLEVSRFWDSKAGDIVSRYAHWLEGFGNS